MDKQTIGTVYHFCPAGFAPKCPVAVEVEVSGEKGLAIRDDFGGEIKLTDEELRFLADFLQERLSV